MITRDTAARIAYAYDEIKAANGLLSVIEEAAKTGDPPDFRDDFGRRRHTLQLGVPHSGGHRLMDVSHKLAAIIIKAHVKDKQDEIEALSELARGEMS
jgi:hypothetical protein